MLKKVGGARDETAMKYFLQRPVEWNLSVMHSFGTSLFYEICDVELLMI